MQDHLATFCEDLPLTAQTTLGDDSIQITNPLDTTPGAANPQTMQGNAHFNEDVVAAFFPRAANFTPTYIEFVCTDPAGASMTDITLQLVVADDAVLSTNLQVLAQSGNILKARLDDAATENVAVYVGLPPLNTAILNSTPLFLGCRFVATGSGGDYGTWTASLVTGVKKIKAPTFESGFYIEG